MDESVTAIFETVAAAAGEIEGVFGEGRSGAAGENPSGETQLAADVAADEILEKRLLDMPAVGSYASEEREEPVGDEGPLHVACDPLDGSSNLESNNGMGTIVGIYDEPFPAAGDALLGACYVLYGPTTTMVTAADGTVSEYLIEDGGWDILEKNILLPEDPTVYGFGGRVPDWPPEFAAYVEEVENERLKLRYGGAMVADVNQVLNYGGIFGYPMLADRPDGKLRLQFEGHPMAAIISMAGGASTDGTQSLLEKGPTELHERSPVFVGNESLIERLTDLLDQ